MSAVEKLKKEINELRTKADGWANVFTGHGISGRDKSVSNTFCLGKVITNTEQDELYRLEGISKRIVDLPIGDMIREWFAIDGDPEGLIVERMKELKSRQAFIKGLRWAQVFGGAITVMRIDDGGKLDEPLDIGRVKIIDSLRTYDRWCVSRESYYTDEEDKKYGEVEVYRVNPVTGNGHGSFSVHESRVLVWDGIDCTDYTRESNDGWGDSVYQSTYESLSRLGVGYGSLGTIISEFIIGVFTIKNLAQLIAAGKEGIVKKRLRLVDLSKSILQSVLIDEGEKYDRISSTVSGLDKIFEKMIQHVSAVTGIPVTLLVGESPAGLNATGDSDIRNYYDKISSRQEIELQPNIERLVEIIMAEREGPMKASPFDNWQVNFFPLWTATEKEQAETNNIQSQADERYYNMGLPESIIFKSRFSGNECNLKTELTDEYMELLETDTFDEEDIEEDIMQGEDNSNE